MLLASWLFVLQVGTPQVVSGASVDPCLMSAFAQLVKRSDGILGRTEAASFLVRNDDGSMVMLFWPRVQFSRKETFRGAIPPGTIAIAHTHPHNMARPSRGDHTEAVRLGLPIYAVSLVEVWAADPGSVRPIQVVARGSWLRRASQSACQIAVTELQPTAGRKDPRLR